MAEPERKSRTKEKSGGGGRRRKESVSSPRSPRSPHVISPRPQRSPRAVAVELAQPPRLTQEEEQLQAAVNAALAAALGGRRLVLQATWAEAGGAARTPAALCAGAGRLLEAVHAALGAALEGQRGAAGLVLLQAAARRWLVRRRLHAADATRAAALRRAAAALRELLATERAYIAALEQVVAAYLVPLRARAHTQFELQDIVAIFSNIELIVDVHRSLRDALAAAAERAWPRVEGVGLLFLQHAKRLEIYGDYAENFVASKIALNAVLSSKKSKLREILERRNEDGPNLEVALFSPVQRMSKYHTILEALCEAVGELSAHEQEMLSRAQALVLNVRNLVHKKLEEAERTAEIQELQRQLVADVPVSLLAEGRAVVARGMLPAKKPLQFCLFTDALLLTRPAGDQAKLLGLCGLREVELERMGAGGSSKAVFELRLLTEPPVTHLLKADKQALEELEALQGHLAKLKREGAVFGAELERLLAKEGRSLSQGGNGVPLVVHFLCTYLRLNSLDTQGLLRQPGTYGKIEALKRRLDNGMLKNYDSIDLSKEDPHDVAGALRHYFAELPEPLIPFEYYEQFMEVQRNSGLSVQGRVDAIANLVQRLPAGRRPLLQYIISFLQAIEMRSEVNKMSVVNLAIVFSPNLLRPRVETMQNALEMPLLQGIVQILIEQGEVVFKSARARRRQSKLFTPSGRPLSVLFVGTDMTQCKQNLSIQAQMEAMRREQAAASKGTGLKLVDFSQPSKGTSAAEERARKAKYRTTIRPGAMPLLTSSSLPDVGAARGSTAVLPAPGKAGAGAAGHKKGQTAGQQAAGQQAGAKPAARTSSRSPPTSPGGHVEEEPQARSGKKHRKHKLQKGYSLSKLGKFVG